MRTKSNSKAKDWVASINDAGQKPPEGWCHPHRFGSYAPPRGFIDDGSRAQWFVDGEAAFEAIASAIENAKSEVYLSFQHPYACVFVTINIKELIAFVSADIYMWVVGLSRVISTTPFSG